MRMAVVRNGLVVNLVEVDPDGDYESEGELVPVGSAPVGIGWAYDDGTWTAGPEPDPVGQLASALAAVDTTGITDAAVLVALDQLQTALEGTSA